MGLPSKLRLRTPRPDLPSAFAFSGFIECVESIAAVSFACDRSFITSLTSGEFRGSTPNDMPRFSLYGMLNPQEVKKGKLAGNSKNRGNKSSTATRSLDDASLELVTCGRGESLLLCVNGASPK
jgi:hypothetical protein